MTDVARTPGDTSLADVAALAETSFDVITGLQHASGAYPASPTFSAYAGYSWFRDGAFIADAVSAFGGIDSATRFFDWCARVLEQHEDQIVRIVAASERGEPVSDGEMLATRFTFDGEEGMDAWWDFQLDGYGTWLWAVVEHARRHGVSLEPWRHAIDLGVDYLLSSWQRPCFDWWEENAHQVHVSTLGCIAAGLAAAVGAGTLDHERGIATEKAVEEIVSLIRETGTTGGHLAKWLGSTEVDASLLAIVYPLGVFPASSAIGAATIAAVDRDLNIEGGVHRYLADTYYGGGQWPLLSCMLGLAYAASGDRDRAYDQLVWAASTAGERGMIPEQVDDHLLAPEMRQEWVDRWGSVADPLLWSHAMYLRLAVELGIAGNNFTGESDR